MTFQPHCRSLTDVGDRDRSIREDLAFYTKTSGRRTTFLAQWISALSCCAACDRAGRFSRHWRLRSQKYGKQQDRGALQHDVCKGRTADLMAASKPFPVPGFWRWLIWRNVLSLMFYKLNKTLQIIVAVALPLLRECPSVDDFQRRLRLWRFGAASSWNLLRCLVARGFWDHQRPDDPANIDPRFIKMEDLLGKERPHNINQKGIQKSGPR